jgi:hypothetical protein
MSYEVELINFPGLHEAGRMAAIRTFCEVLEERLGGASGVLSHHAAYRTALEFADENLSHPKAESAAAFMVARHMAERAALTHLDAPSNAHFVVTPRPTS